MDFDRKRLPSPDITTFNKNGPIKYDLHDLSSRNQFPVQVKEIKEANQSVHLGKSRNQNTHTLLAIIHTKQIKCISSNENFTYFSPAHSEPVLTTPIERGIHFSSLFDVIENQKKHKISWVVVTQKFDVRNETFDVGELLEIKPTSLCKRLNCFISAKQKHDTVTVVRHKTKNKHHLPSETKGEFEQCQSPLSCYKVLSDLILENEFPFIITLPEETYVQKRGSSPIWKKIIAVELIGFSLVFLSDFNNDVIVQAIPDSVEINVELVNKHDYLINNDFNNVDFNDYKDVLIENISLLERNPVRLKDLLPNNKSDFPFCPKPPILRRSPNINHDKSKTPHSVSGNKTNSKTTKEEILDDIRRKRSNETPKNPRKTSKVLNSVLKFEKKSNEKVLFKNLPSDDSDYEDMNATYAPPSPEEDSPFGENGYLQPIPNFEVPVYRARTYDAHEMERPAIVKRTISEGEKAKTITVGVDGYVIVAPLPEEREKAGNTKCNTSKQPFLEPRLTHVRARFATSPPASRNMPPIKERHLKPLPLPKPPLTKLGFGEVSI